VHGVNIKNMQTKISKFGLFLRGLAMGTADVIPGVSGGTIAFVTGVYQELIETLSCLGPRQFKLLLKGDVRSIAKDLNLTFTLPLGLGVLTAILSLAQLMPMLIRDHPFETFSFFFGLILCSAYVPYQLMNKNMSTHTLLFVCFALSAVFFFMNPSLALPQTALGFFVAGAIAICAMILPGISGAYLLVLMGQYQHVLDALHTRYLPTVLVFSLGCLVGLLSFARFLKYVLTNHKHTTFSVLTGLMLGSLVRIWPFAYPVESGTEATTYGISAGLFVIAVGVMVFLIRLDPSRRQNLQK
jgi:putative membrane protein